MSVVKRSIFWKILFFPFVVVYATGVAIRNWLFDIGILPSEKFDTPIISVGNITVGGTGKTPFTEYLVRLLQPGNQVGVLSRGYKRKTSGYVVSTESSTPEEIGDEPSQIKQKFPNVLLAVDANRRRGIKKMLNEPNKPDVFILDDAYQHRYVKPDISILLIDYNRMITEDSLMPLGQLREPLKSKNRANIVVVNKCPSDIKPIEFRIIRKNLNLFPYQTLYFTTIQYDDFKPVFPKYGSYKIQKNVVENENLGVLCVTGIASPAPFEQYVSTFASSVRSVKFGDHHKFDNDDISKIEKAFNSFPNKHNIILTTEKDAVRLKGVKMPDSLKKVMYYIPLSIHFMLGDGSTFDKQIVEYVDKNRRCLRVS
ncbi:MAG TPA: tetraacyldisaccharide 4'-kinase [Paludibacteraceae bacterium]|nr:tetraacyldisaccharide 4'-kinase [Paludibacteraceae bacterium]HOU69040.1 tetraacyldisaccharide 4'-kinase [Paludibacteraceae bacterium]HPH62692.1 tetraacyldisaccharide 4'-kinase [Paludibacteraceae bacterium]HQF50851.1 tetraacyldisaccharide 4'-kinase [Paludibacteraceae bacterium]HQJ90051.1 tetraacyldisaccharide 4'-kinase [Paludibacteraceae bacterium]